MSLRNKIVLYSCLLFISLTAIITYISYRESMDKTIASLKIDSLNALERLSIFSNAVLRVISFYEGRFGGELDGSSAVRDVILEALSHYSFGKRGYLQVFSPDGKLIISSKSVLGEDDSPSSPHMRKVFEAPSGSFAYDWGEEKKVRAFFRLKPSPLGQESVLVLTAYLYDFAPSLYWRRYLARVFPFIGVFAFLLFLVLDLYLRRGFFSFLDSLSKGFDSLMRGNYDFKMNKFGERFLDEVVDRFNAVSSHLSAQKEELEATYSELLSLNKELSLSKEELEATYAQLRAYASSLENLNLLLSRSNEILKMVLRAGEELLLVSKEEDPIKRIYEILSRFYGESSVLGIYEISPDSKLFIKKIGDGDERIEVGRGVESACLEGPCVVAEGESSKFMVPIKFLDKIYGIIVLQTGLNALSKLDVEVISMLASLIGIALANKDYFASAVEKTKKLKALVKVSELLVSSRDLIGNMEPISKAIVEELGYDNLEVLLKENGKLKRVAALGKISEISYGNGGWDIEKGIIGWVARHGKGAFVPDVRKDHRYVQVYDGVKGEIAVPIIGDGEVYGVINVESECELTFDDYEILSILGRELGIALRKEKLLKSVQDEAKRFKILYELSLRLSALEPIEDILGDICAKIKEDRSYVDVTVAVYDKYSQKWKFLAGGVKDLFSDEDLHELMRAGGVISTALRLSKIINVPDVSSVSYYVKVFEDTRSELAVPMRVGGEILGILNVESPRLNDFTKEDEEFFDSVAKVVGLAIARDHLIKDLIKQSQRLMALLEVSRGLISIRDKVELYNYVCESLVKYVGYKRVVYREPDWEAGLLMLRAESPLGAGVVDQVKIDDSTTVGHVVLTGSPLLVRDLNLEPRFRKIYKSTRSVVAVPVKLDGKVVGVLIVSDSLPGAFDKRDEELLLTLSNIISSALKSIDAMESLEKKTERMGLLYELSLSLTRANSEDEVYDTVMSFLRRVKSYSRITIQVLDGDKLVFKRAYPEVGRFERIKLGQGVTGWVARTGESLLVPDVSKDPRYLPGLEGIKSELAVPIRVRGEVFGVLNLESELPGVFSEDDRWLVEAVGASMGVVLENLSYVKELEDNFFATTLALAKTIEYKDPYTRGHCERVMILADRLALRIGLSEAERKKLRYASILHDIGKIGIPGRILDKPGKLTEDEYEVVKRHPVLGEELIKDVPFLKEVSLFVRWHHERWDGKGYPDGLKGYEIPLEDRIMSIADAFDAMTSERPYRRALKLDDAILELKRGAGSQFDPLLVNEFLKMLEEEGGIESEDRS